MAQRRLVNRQNMIGNTRMDAALDAMDQFGFKRKLVRETVDELLDVYEGKQGWPFIEEASYKLLIETILAKQQSSVEEKNNSSETASAATATTGITEVGSSSRVAQNSVLQARDDLDSASQTSNHHGPPPLSNLDTDVKDTTLPFKKREGYGRGVRVESKNKQKSMDATLPTKRGGDGRGIRLETKDKQKSMDNVQGSSHKTYAYNVKKTAVRSSVIESSKTPDKLMDNVRGNNHKTSVSSAENTILRSSMIESANKHDKLMNNYFEKGSNHRTFVNKVENTIAGNSMNESSKTRDELPHRQSKPCYGWIGSDDDDVDLIYFPVPEHIKKLIAQSDGSQIPKGKSRLDEKADDM